MGHILHNHIYLFDMFLSLAWSLYIYTVFISSLSSNFSCPPDDERASILRAILYHVLCSSICTSLKHFLLILHASVLTTDRSTQGTKRWVKFQWLEWSSRVSMYAGGWQLQGFAKWSDRWPCNVTTEDPASWAERRRRLPPVQSNMRTEVNPPEPISIIACSLFSFFSPNLKWWAPVRVYAGH